MDLVTKTYTQVSTQYVITDGSSSSVFMKTNLADKTIQRVLNSLRAESPLVYPTTIKNEFDLFLQYAQAKTDGATDTEFDSFDNYLGSIGV